MFGSYDEERIEALQFEHDMAGAGSELAMLARQGPIGRAMAILSGGGDVACEHCGGLIEDCLVLYYRSQGDDDARRCECYSKPGRVLETYPELDDDHDDGLPF